MKHAIPADYATMVKELELAKRQRASCWKNDDGAGAAWLTGRILDLEAAIKADHEFAASISNS